MAYSLSPQTVVAGSSTHFDRISGSPPLQPPLSKRDKKRVNMTERLTEISKTFAANRDMHYRQQLQAYQADINYIQIANPYDNKPLDDPSDDVSDEIAGSAAASIQGSLRTAHQGNGRTETSFKTGRHTAEFVQEINDAMEQRDVDLTVLTYRHNFRIEEIMKDNEYQTALAHQEHQRLLEALRQRLIQNVNQKKAALQKEKERLDIADSNALLFHPNQFALSNTASPGGPQSNRKTRHTRHRLEVEDMDAASSNNKRKRKAPAEAENGSPIPAGRDLEHSSVFNEANTKLETHQFIAPLYTIDRLFTERELNGYLQQASYDVIESFKRRKLNPDNTVSLAPTNADVSDMEDERAVELNFGNDGPVDDTLLTAPDMGRTVTNTSYHATRSTRLLNFNNGISASETLGELAGRHAGAGMIGTYQRDKKREEEYQRAPPLTDQEADSDLALMKQAIADEDGGKLVNTKLLEDLVEDREDYVGTGGLDPNPQADFAFEAEGS